MSDKSKPLSVPKLPKENPSAQSRSNFRQLPDVMRSSLFVHPCAIDGQSTLVHERGLQKNHPVIYQRLQNFAELTGVHLFEDRRSNFIEGVKRVKGRRKANVVSIFVLTAALLSHSVYALPGEMEILDERELEEIQAQINYPKELDFDNYESQEELISGIFDWINHHSSFNHDTSQMPDVVQVSATRMAEIAFGDTLPKSIGPEELRIYGLYNFHESRIYLLDSLDINSTQGRGVLLHELVHYLQYQYGDDEDVACKNELESLAYILEAKFLQSHGHEHKITESHLRKISECS